MADTLPPNTGYVAAAYLVFVALLLIYFVIMAVKAARVERELAELLTLAANSESSPFQAEVADHEDSGPADDAVKQ